MRDAFSRLTVALPVAFGCLALAATLVPVAYAAPPGNDAFDAAQVLSGTRPSVTGSAAEATHEPGEPDHAGESGAGSVWYRWTAPRSGHVSLDGCPGDLGFNAALAVYEGSQVGGLTRVAEGSDGCAFGPRLVFEAQAGHQYSIAVDGTPSGLRPSSSFRLDLRLPANDDFADAERLPAAGARSEADNIHATSEANEPQHAGNAGGASLWYRWRAPSDGIYRVGTCASDFNTLLAVYTGPSLGALTEVASDDDEAAACGPGQRGSSLVFDATAGTDYRIAVDGYNNGVSPRRGSVSLHLRRSENTSIAYSVSSPAEATRGVWLMNGANGADKRRVIPGHYGAPAWDPEAGALAVEAFADADIGIHLLEIGAGPMRRLTTQLDQVPDFSPDGRRIAFARQGIRLMDADGSNERLVTPSDAHRTPFKPSFSPDGKRIAFQSGGRIMVVDVNGENLRSLTTGDTSLDRDAAPSFSPDGRWVAFVREGEGVMLTRPEGGDPVLLKSDATARDPAFSPDGTRLAYSSVEPVVNGSGGERVILSVRADGSQSLVLARGDDPSNPDWGPFDTIGAVAAIVDGPEGSFSDKTPTFQFQAQGEESTFECRVDAAAFEPCSTIHTTGPLSEGPHVLSVRARDGRGNLGAPATRSFTVDTVAPDTELAGGEGESPEREFALSSEPGARFECSLDEAGFSACVSPHRVGPLGDGPHVLEAVAIDAAGNRDSSPARWTFTVRRPPPAPPPTTPEPGSGESPLGVAPLGSSPGAGTPGVDRLAPNLRLPRSLRRRGGRLALRLSCPASEGSGPCRGRVVVRLLRPRGRAGPKLASGRFSIPSGGTRTVRLRLSRRGHLALRRVRLPRLQAVATVMDARGNRRIARRRMGLVRR